MRGSGRERLVLAGKICVAVSLTTSAVFAIASGRLGWTNYWGGFVYAPFALIIAVLFVVFLIKKGNRPVDQARRRSR